MTYAELVELAQQGTAKLAEITAQLALAEALLKRLSDELELGGEPFVEVDDHTSEMKEGQAVVTEVQVRASGPASVVAVGAPAPVDCGTTRVMPGADSVEFVPGVGFHAEASYEFTVALDDSPDVQAVGRVDVVPEAVVEPDPDPVPDPNPPPIDPTPLAGPPIKRHPLNKHMIMCGQNSVGKCPALSKLGSKLYRFGIAFGKHQTWRLKENVPQTEANILEGTIDHSEAGWYDHARALIYVLKDHKANNSSLANCLWLDAENPAAKHINVPKSCTDAGWVQGGKNYTTISTYQVKGGAPTAFRLEAARYQAGVARAFRELCAAQGLKNAEIGSYNIPSKRTDYTASGAQDFTTQGRETRDTVFGPKAMSFGGHSMYFSTGGYRTLSEYISHYTRTVKGIRAAYGPNHKIVPAIWPRFFLGGASTYPGDASKGCPSGLLIPKGWFRTFAEALLDAGVDGFVCWTSSGDGASGFSDRWEEIVDLVNDVGTFTRPGT